MYKYLIKEIVNAIYQYPNQIVIHTPDNLAMMSESAFYQELVPLIYDFYQNQSQTTFLTWLNKYLSKQSFSPYYQAFCCANLAGVKINSLYYYTHLARIFRFLVNDRKDVTIIQRVGLDLFIEGKSPYIGTCYHQWLVRHFKIELE